jgi:hypothetical protein
LSHFETNLALLAAKQPELANQLKLINSLHVKVAASASGLPTATFERESTQIPLHNRYNPLREAHQQLKKEDCKGADYFIFLGFGLGYLLDALIEKFANPANHYFIVESDLEILRAAFEARDLSHLLAGHNVYFAWPASGPELAAQWQKNFAPALANKSIFLTHMPSLALNPNLYKSAAEIINRHIFQTFTDINTLIVHSETFLNNFVKNFSEASKAPGITSLAGLFSEIPAIIVSAGPSLDKNIHELRGCENRALILSTDTALKPLLFSGIDPHFVLTGDPSITNYLHLKDAPTKEAILVAEATSYPSVFEEFAGRIVACSYDQSALKSLSSLLENKGILKPFGSVATIALDFALLLGCNPIIFIGQDLAHTDGRIYCSGIYLEEQWFQGIIDPDGYQEKLKSLRSQGDTIIFEDIFGRPVESTKKLASYWNWILKVINDHPKVRFINATEGGILRGSIEIMSLKEALFRCCRKNLNLRSRVQHGFQKASATPLSKIKESLALLEKEQRSLQSVLNQGLKLCESQTGLSPQAVMKELEKVNSAIYSHRQLAPLIDSFNQMGNRNFLRKRHLLLQNIQEMSLIPDIKKTYSEFYLSYQQALTIIKNALSQLQAEAPTPGDAGNI